MLGMNAVALVFFGCITVAAVKQLLPQSVWTVALPVYYVALAAFVLLTIRGFFRKNQKQYRKFSTKATRGMAEDHTSCCFIIIARRSGPGSGGYAPAWDCQ